MPAACPLGLVMAIVLCLSAMQPSNAAGLDTEHHGSLSSVSVASDTLLRKTEANDAVHPWSSVASLWWAKNRTAFQRGFYTGLSIAFVIGGSGLLLAVMSGLYVLAASFSWHAKVKGGPMLPLHHLGCA